MMRRLICSVSCVVLLTFFSASNAQGQQPHRTVTEASMKNIVEGVLLVIAMAGEIGGVWNRLKLDRKSTRLNSSHGYISYAVFCLKKKKVQPSMSRPHRS